MHNDRTYCLESISLNCFCTCLDLFKPCLFYVLQRLSDDKANSITAVVKELSTELLVPGLGITHEEKIEIVRAVGLQQGHWYKCPNGKTRHV